MRLDFEKVASAPIVISGNTIVFLTQLSKCCTGLKLETRNAEYDSSQNCNSILPGNSEMQVQVHHIKGSTCVAYR